ncbi:4,5-DOPA dioxygenase extradiol [Saprospira grandis]|uniref:4,5-DOPA-extradiol-dioxygenase n=1 Tax=Saprospira grandis TaxID=1008 RepID=UPI0022DE5479|nr:4,5-DOPA dioxygenase extradiol [Saprospira grandis]WBM75919.1 4,5-DOPA dioxygenase extradiol [Saprospira grandis]
MKRKDFVKWLALSPFLFAMQPLSKLGNWSDSLDNSAKMPVLFLGHGSPMNAIEENQFVRNFRDLGKKLPKPKAILCVSAHWLTQGTKIMASDPPKTIHDFGGFPQALFDVQYPAPGDQQLAREVRDMVGGDLDHSWGLDHGSWSVIKHLYPKADVPVIQMSIDYNKPASYHFELAKKLQQLRHKGVLIVGSGNIIHNLRRVNFSKINTIGYGYDWAKEVHAKTGQYLKDQNYQALIDYKKGGKAFELAVPTPDHYFPMIYSIGLADKNDQIRLFNDELLGGSLNMTSFILGEGI